MSISALPVSSTSADLSSHAAAHTPRLEERSTSPPWSLFSEVIHFTLDPTVTRSQFELRESKQSTVISLISNSFM